jgi:hypothetical protein
MVILTKNWAQRHVAGTWIKGKRRWGIGTNNFEIPHPK